MTDFRSLGTYEVSGSTVASISFTGLNVTDYSVLEIHWQLFSDYDSVAYDRVRLVPSSGTGGASGDGGTNNSGVSWGIGTSNTTSVGTGNSVNGSTNNQIIGMCIADFISDASDWTGTPGKAIIYNPTKEVGSYERDITVYCESTPGFGSAWGGSVDNKDVTYTIVTWPGRTDDSISSLTFSPVNGSNWKVGSWIAVYGYYQE